MTPENKARLKKYLFYISIFFVAIIGAQLMYLFLYFDSKEQPTSGGVLSEGMIGEIPSLNPLVNENENNAYIMSLVFRSLMNYDPVEKKFIPDIAECDFDKLEYIKCFIQPGLKWSDGSSITASDVVATLKTIKEEKLNYSIASLLSETTIEQGDSYIVFSNLKKDINFLNILSQPIVKKDFIDKMPKDSLKDPFNPFTSIYSGKYVISGTSVNDSLGIKELSLAVNDAYDNKPLIEKITFKFFKNNSHLIKHQDQIKSFYDKDKIITGTNPRFEIKEHLLNQYTSVFINSNKIKDSNFRTIILSNINRDQILEKLGIGYKPIYNPFITDEKIDVDLKGKDISNFVNELGFFKKQDLAEKVTIKNEEDKALEYFNSSNPDLNHILGPINKKYNFISNNYLLDLNKSEVAANKYSILFTGSVKGEKPTGIIINDYKLKGYSAGNELFYYRINTQANNLKLGTNNYKVYFEYGDEKKLVDEFNVFYEKTDGEIENIKTNLINRISEELKSKGENSEISGEEVNEIGELENKYFYDTNKNPFTLNLYYVSSSGDNFTVAKLISEELDEIGIKSNLVEITISELGDMIASGNKEYDLLISGTNLGYFDFNIFPYFHSSQVKNGFNLSLIKKPELDISLESLKEYQLSESKRDKIKSEILETLKSQQVVKTLYSPNMYYLIDKNVKNTKYIDRLAYYKDVSHFYNGAYITYDKKIKSEEKGVISFIKFLYEILND